MQVIGGQKTPNDVYVAGLKKSIDQIERLFLAGGKHKFIGGQMDVSFADLICAAELEQPMMAG
jgi:hypothetical protein